jgi:hypothetical protein
MWALEGLLVKYTQDLESIHTVDKPQSDSKDKYHYGT